MANENIKCYIVRLLYRNTEVEIKICDKSINDILDAKDLAFEIIEEAVNLNYFDYDDLLNIEQMQNIDSDVLEIPLKEAKNEVKIDNKHIEPLTNYLNELIEEYKEN